MLEKLTNAVSSSNTNDVKSLIKNKVMDLPLVKHSNILITAVKVASTDILKMLIIAKADLHAKDEINCTALHHAAMMESKQDAICIRLLLRARSNIFAKNNNGSTPLHYAAFHGRLNTTKILLKARSEISTKNKHRYTAYDLAKNKCHTGLIDLLCFHGCPLNRAARDGDVCKMRELLKAKADINKKDSTEATALHRLIELNHTSAMALLWSYKPNLHIQNKNGSTALHYAAYYGRTNMINLMLEATADVNVKNEYGETAYDMAYSQENKTVLHIFETTLGLSRDSLERSMNERRGDREGDPPMDRSKRKVSVSPNAKCIVSTELMSEEFKLSPNDIDLSKKFLRDDGTCSLSMATEHTQEGLVITPDIFYVKSDRLNVYAKIQIKQRW